MKRLSSILAAMTMAAQIFSPVLTYAQSTSTYTIPEEDLKDGFDPNQVLSDSDIFDLGKMDLQSIRNFLSVRGTLGTIKIRDIDGVEKEPAQIIWRVATSYKINPQYLLALMQKEQSLVEDTSPTQRQFDWATGFGVCDSCSKDDPAISDFKGFANQLEYAAKQHRERYLMQILGKGSTISGYAPGKLTTVDAVAVRPANNATAMLYTYTPHIHGNLNLWHIWRRWFSLQFPEGTIAQGKSSGEIYLIRLGVKREFKSKSVAVSMIDPNKIVQVEDSQLSAYPDGPAISYPNYSIVQTEDGKLYLLDGESKRLITSKTVYYKLGFNDDDIVDGTKADLAVYTDGRDISSDKQYPRGYLAQDKKGGVWFIQDGVKQPITDISIFNLYFKGRKPKAMDDKTLATYETGKPYALRDGELVRGASKPDVYVVENGELRPILSGEVFEQLGWQWRNIVTVPDRVIKDYAIGEPVQLQTAPKLNNDTPTTLAST